MMKPLFSMNLRMKKTKVKKYETPPGKLFEVRVKAVSLRIEAGKGGFHLV